MEDMWIHGFDGPAISVGPGGAGGGAMGFDDPGISVEFAHGLIESTGGVADVSGHAGMTIRQTVASEDAGPVVVRDDASVDIDGYHIKDPSPSRHRGRRPGNQRRWWTVPRLPWKDQE